MPRSKPKLGLRTAAAQRAVGERPGPRSLRAAHAVFRDRRYNRCCSPPQQPGSYACVDSASLQSRCSCSWSPARMSEALRARRPRRLRRLPRLRQVPRRRPRRPPPPLPQRRLSTRRRPARLRTLPRRPLCPRRIHRRVPHDPARHPARARNPAPPHPRPRKRCTRPHRLRRPQRPRARPPPLGHLRRWI